jgi:hypothetical protein
MSSLPIDEISERHLISNVTIEKSPTESSSLNSTHVNIRFTIALAVPTGKFS